MMLESATATACAVADPAAVPDHGVPQELLEMGFSLRRLQPFTKAPAAVGWEQPHARETAIDPAATGYGVTLAENGLCSLDIDNRDAFPRAAEALGIDAERWAELEAAGYRSLSTRPGSGGRLTFKLPPGLQLTRRTFKTREHGTILELRAGNLQDALPGCLYRGADGTIYRQTAADPRTCLADAAELPAWLAATWQRLCVDPAAFAATRQTVADAVGGTLRAEFPGPGAGMLPFPSPYRGDYEAAHRVPEILERHGYIAGGQGRYWPPGSQCSNAPGVREVPGKSGQWATSHTSDPLFRDDGRDETLFAAWDAHVLLDYGGDLQAAESAAAAERAASDAQWQQGGGTGAQLAAGGDDPELDALEEPAPMPNPIGAAAYHGLAGEFVQLVAGTTEADPSNLLATFLTMAGGADPFRRRAEMATGQPLNLYTAVVGRTGAGRKGTGWALVRDLFAHALPLFAPVRLRTSLSSGEALVHAVRDPRRRPAKPNEAELADENGMVLADPGSPDKRLVAQLSEMVGLFAVLDRDSNTLAARMMEAWDGQPIQVNVRDSGRGGYGCAQPHISAVGHVTPVALRKAILGSGLDQNGFANRWLYVRSEAGAIISRPKLWGPGDPDWTGMAERLAATVNLEPGDPVLRATAETWEAWDAWYHPHRELERTAREDIAPFLVRSAAFAARLAGVYAMLDRSTVIIPAHLQAALAVVEHSENCARWLFERPAVLSDDARLIRQVLQQSPDGLTLTELANGPPLHKNWSRSRRNQALGELRVAGLLSEAQRETAGKAATVLTCR